MNAPQIATLRAATPLLALAAGFALVPTSRADVAMDFEWWNSSRTLIYSMDPSMDQANVFDNPDQDRRPRANPMGTYTMGDASRLAINTWNYANANIQGGPGAARTNAWTMLPTGLLGVGELLLPHVTFKMGSTALAANDPGPVTGVPRFRAPPMGSGSQGGRARNDDDGQRQGGAGGVTDALALFVLKDQISPTQWRTAEIIFNPNVAWGTTGGNMVFDPIIVAMHEIGHAFRLDHMSIVDGISGRVNNTIGPERIYPDGSLALPDGPVMRPFTDRGNNMMNPLGGTIYDRYPDFLDISEATRASTFAPSPAGSATLAFAGVTLMLKRRRSPRA